MNAIYTPITYEGDETESVEDTTEETTEGEAETNE